MRTRTPTPIEIDWTDVAGFEIRRLERKKEVPSRLVQRVGTFAQLPCLGRSSRWHVLRRVLR